MPHSLRRFPAARAGKGFLHRLPEHHARRLAFCLLERRQRHRRQINPRPGLSKLAVEE